MMSVQRLPQILEGELDMFFNRADAEIQAVRDLLVGHITVPAHYKYLSALGRHPGYPAVYQHFRLIEKDLVIATDACGEIADYAKPYGITTSIENHGVHFQGSERVQRLVLAVNRDNFRTTMESEISSVPMRTRKSPR